MSTKYLASAVSAAFILSVYAGCSAPPDTIGGPGGGYGQGSGNGTGSGGGAGGGTGSGGTNGGTTGGGGGGATGTGAKAFFIASVDPSIGPTCNSCHATGANSAPMFLAGTADASYTAITSTTFTGLIAAPANSLLILHGAHTGPALTQAQHDLVTQWLNMEVKERGINPAPVETVQQAIGEFGACMSLADFTDRSATGVSAADVARQQTTRDGPCQGCHNAGDGGFWASSGTINNTNLTTVMFQSSQTLPYIKKWVTGIVDMNGNFKDLAPSNSIENKAALAAQCVGPACHPKFQLSTAAQQAIDAFVQKTLTKWRAKACSGGTGPADAGPG